MKHNKLNFSVIWNSVADFNNRYGFTLFQCGLLSINHIVSSVCFVNENEKKKQSVWYLFRFVFLFRETKQLKMIFSPKNCLYVKDPQRVYKQHDDIFAII